MPDVPLACSVRSCGLPLERRERAFTCSAGHSFDIARSGYLNLLQPQDRRSPQAGDSKAAVEARAALDRSGVGRALIDAVIDRVAALHLPPDAIVLDLGAGSGEMLGKAWTGLSIAGIGIDLSVAAVELASRRFPSLTWIVANADRRLPIRDRSVDVILSVHGRRNPSESARVLKEAGLLIVALPAPDDLIELRALVQGQGLERDRVEAMLEEHATHFELIERFQVRDQRQLERDALVNLLQGTYRGARFTSWMKVAAIEPMAVTLSSDVCVLKCRTGG
ncbi:MAG TPA: methyltransferase domain-containing protein [Vicinamibacterales bacterium]|nr:methyltransferase domain-containing protein [Vicinamibacterales bacterium]